MRRLRVSAISYLNTAPLMWDFEHTHVGSAFDISYTLPSLCAAALQNGSADIGIIPAAAYATTPDLLILPGVAIASKQAVRSILLVSKVPAEQIQTVVVDSSSLTSVALLQILFTKLWGGVRPFTTMAPDVERMLEQHDAGLVIGDPALKVDRAGYFTYDLAEEWIRLTAHPFVFAVWAVRQTALKDLSPTLDLASIFQESRDHGVREENLERIAREWARRMDLSESDIKSYLTQNIHYYLDPACLNGMQLFFHYAEECGILTVAPLPNFVNVAKTLIA
jgi:chorismate dehydratase